MATKKFLTLDRLTEYDALIKAEITEGDESVKSYVDTELAKKANSSHSHAISDVTDLQTTLDEISEKANESDLFVVNVTKNSDSTYSTDKTFAEIKEAYNDGKVCVARDWNRVDYRLVQIDDDCVFFHYTYFIGTSVCTQEFYITSDSVDYYVYNANIGLCANLNTENKQLVKAINEVHDELDSHNHNDLYYTETEIDTKLSTINTSITNITSGSTPVKEAEHATSADSATHATTADSATSATKATQDGNGKVISSTYETKTDATAKLNEAKAYADGIKNDLLNGAGGAYDTLKELGDLIDVNVDAIEALETVAAGKADADHNHDDVYYTETEVDALLANKKGNDFVVTLTYDSGTSAYTSDKTPAEIYAAYTSGKYVYAKSSSNIYQLTLCGSSLAQFAAFFPATNSGGNFSITSSKVIYNSVPYYTESEVDTLLATKANSSHTHTVANITDLTATATELNYMDGVTSNVQTQLDGLDELVNNRALKSHTHVISDVANLQSTLDGKASSSHSHTITATATDDDVIVLTGTNGTNKVTFDAKHATSGVTAGTYKSVTVNAYGHVTGGSNPTTLSGYGITDAYTKTQVDSIASGKAASSHTHSDATTSAAGFMTAAMVTKLNGIATGATKVTVDSSLSSTSTNPVQNKVVNSAISTLTSSVSANTSSISSHTTAISNLQTAVGEFEEITSAEIQALFA